MTLSTSSAAKALSLVNCLRGLLGEEHVSMTSEGIISVYGIGDNPTFTFREDRIYCSIIKYDGDSYFDTTTLVSGWSDSASLFLAVIPCLGRISLGCYEMKLICKALLVSEQVDFYEDEDQDTLGFGTVVLKFPEEEVILVDTNKKPPYRKLFNDLSVVAALREHLPKSE